jgi:hypothetical protein
VKYSEREENMSLGYKFEGEEVSFECWTSEELRLDEHLSGEGQPGFTRDNLDEFEVPLSVLYPPEEFWIDHGQLEKPRSNPKPELEGWKISSKLAMGLRFLDALLKIGGKKVAVLMTCIGALIAFRWVSVPFLAIGDPFVALILAIAVSIFFVGLLFGAFRRDSNS